jgi:hypothetical protein
MVVEAGEQVDTQAVASTPVAIGFLEHAKDLQAADDVLKPGRATLARVRLWACCSGVSGIGLRLRLEGVRLFAWSLARPC